MTPRYGRPTFSIEQTAIRAQLYAVVIMTLQRIKMTVSAVWVLIATLIAIVVDMSLTRGLLVASLGLLPPLALLLLWNEPTRSMSESINDARR